MKKRLVLLLSFLLAAPLFCQAGVPGYMKARMGILTGQAVTEDGSPIPGGVVSFFDAGKGIPPLFANMHRIPDAVGTMKPDGRFAVKLLPGTYYMGALIITDPSRGPGPPRKGETFYFARDDSGPLRTLSIATKEKKDAGRIVMALPESFPEAGSLITIKGRLLREDGRPFAGGVVLVKTDLNKARPDFVSGRTGADGTFSLKLPPDTVYYLIGREQAVGRPAPGTFIGTYGSRKPINEGGALPFSGIRPAGPAAGMPQVENMAIGPGEEQPGTISGKAGEIISGCDIIIFPMPEPGRQREKLQGTLGFSGKNNRPPAQPASPDKE